MTNNEMDSITWLYNWSKDWESRYPVLVSLPHILHCFLCIADEDVALDKENMVKCVGDMDPKSHDEILRQYSALLKMPDVPWVEISYAVNRYFESINEEQKWLSSMYNAIAETEPRYGTYFIRSIPKEKLAKLRCECLYLTDFLISEYPWVDQKGSDEEVAKQYALRIAPDVLRRVIEGGMTLISRNEFPWEEIDRTSGRYFLKQKEFKKWLTNIMQLLKENMRM